jgi:outer membrane protein OmpA-like peptidoglycan-associated protein
LPATVTTMMPEPAPPVPVLAPVAPPPATQPEPKRALSATTVATLDIPSSVRGSVPGAAAAPTGQDRAQIERVAGLYRANPGTVRVIGYAAAPAAGAGGDPLGSYHAALDRAQAVARALAEAGIPANKIQTEAAPTAGARGLGRVEVQFTQ